MKCRYKYCKLGGEVSKEEAIKDGRAYYHKECYQEKQNKKEIREIILDQIPTETSTLVSSIILDIVNKKNIDSNYVLFALKESIRSGFKIYNAKGLYTIANSKINKDKYKKLFIQQNKNNNFDNVAVKKETKFQGKSEKYKLWGDILFGKN